MFFVAHQAMTKSSENSIWSGFLAICYIIQQFYLSLKQLERSKVCHLQLVFVLRTTPQTYSWWKKLMLVCLFAFDNQRVLLEGIGSQVVRFPNPFACQAGTMSWSQAALILLSLLDVFLILLCSLRVASDFIKIIYCFHTSMCNMCHFLKIP